jgi:hypothetical protein
VELLGLFANQAAIALDLLQRARRARAALEGADEELGLVARLAETIDRRAEGDRDAALALLEALERVLRE